MTDAPYEGRVVIITGASSGIGAAMARALAAQGAKLALAARSAERLAAFAEGCRCRGGDAIAVPTDVTDEAACRSLVERTVDTFGRVDMLVNNAGAGMWARFDALETLAPLEHLLRVNATGAMVCTYYALPHLKQSRGRILAISSLAGLTGVPLRSGYAASKHALTGFFDSLRTEVAPDGVSVTVIYPGFVATGAHGRNLGADGTPLGADANPVDYRRAARPEDVARTALAAAHTRRRQVVMTPRGRLGRWLRLVAPGLVDSIARRAIHSGR